MTRTDQGTLGGPDMREQTGLRYYEAGQRNIVCHTES